MTLTDTSDRRIGTVLLLLALLLLAWVLYDLWNRVYAITKGRSAPVVQAVAPAPPVQNPYRVSDIVNSHIFGQKKVVAKAAAPKEKTVTKTRLRLKLIGMVESTDPMFARALISLENGRAQSYGIGDPIDRTDGKVHSVDKGQVIIDRDGRLESLEMVRPSLDDKKDGNQRGGANNSSRNNAAVQRRQPAQNQGVQPVRRRYNNGQRVQPVQRVQRTRRQLPGQIQPGQVQQAQGVPVNDDGTQMDQGGQRRQPSPKFPF